MGPLGLKPCFLRLYAPLRIHPSGSGLLVVKHLELPASRYLRIKKWGNSKTAKVDLIRAL